MALRAEPNLRAMAHVTELYCRESILAIFVFLSQKITMYMNIWCTAVMWKCWKFLAVCWDSMMTLCDYRVDRPFPYHMFRCWVRTRPPPTVWALSHLFKPTFWCLTLSTSKRCHMDLWLAWHVLTHHHCHWHYPSLLHQHLSRYSWTNMESRYSRIPGFQLRSYSQVYFWLQQTFYHVINLVSFSMWLHQSSSVSWV